jgi:cell division protein FtsB
MNFAVIQNSDPPVAGISMKGVPIMRRHTGLLVILLVSFALLSAGCSKNKQKQASLQGEIAALQAQIKQIETKNNDLVGEAEKAALRAAEEKRQLEEALKAYEMRLMHNPFDAFKIEPNVPIENGWMLIDGDRSFTLLDHTGATKVSFYWANSGTGLKPQLLGEDTNEKDGWVWKGSLPFGAAKAFWAEVHYPGGIKVTSSVLPIRSAGK